MISVRMTKDWEYDFVDVNGEIATRKCPRGLVLEFEDEIAASAVASGHAETTAPASEAFSERVRLHKRFLDLIAETGDPDEADRLLREEERARAEDAQKAATEKAKAAKKKPAGDTGTESDGSDGQSGTDADAGAEGETAATAPAKPAGRKPAKGAS